MECALHYCLFFATNSELINENMLPIILKQQLKEDDSEIAKTTEPFFRMPDYDPIQHYKHLTFSNYYRALVVLRHYIKAASDYYFSVLSNAKNIDLFMLTPSVSSPMGPGSDSAPLPIKFGKFESFLVDSSQFGFEPLLINGLDKVYCYLPSIRGENPDARHLNQFFHCELEMRGILSDLMPIIEGYIKILSETVLESENILNKISNSPEATKEFLKKTIECEKFPQITFDEAVDILVKNGKKNLINFAEHGRDISSNGEIELMKIMNLSTPLWLKFFDRDRVAFYQKPMPGNKEKTINADLLFPPLVSGSFGGEIVGSGQRQDSPEEMYESLKRQDNISPDSYKWYIELRKLPGYNTTCGFGLGIERFIAWALAKPDIKDVSIYPRLKNIKTCP